MVVLGVVEVCALIGTVVVFSGWMLGIKIRRRKFFVRGRHVCITGGSEGLGKALAKECILREAQKVTLLSRSASKLSAAAKELRQTTSNVQSVHTFQCDVTLEENVLTTFREVESEVGPVDVLICCSGICIPGAIDDAKPEEFRTMINTNLLGSILPVHAVVPSMKKRKSGCLVFISSQGGQVGIYGLSVYSSSKCAVELFAQSLQQELNYFNIGVCTVFPPDMNTPGFAEENVKKSEITKLVEERGGLLSADEAAVITADGIEQQVPRICFGFTGRFLSTINSGFHPAAGIGELLFECCTLGVFRLGAVIQGLLWQRAINSELKNRDEAS